jgi:2-methylisocitrate lyase-like PEP mutase family enzyme
MRTKDDQIRLAEAFRKRHQGPPLLLLPNAWDAMSARIFEAAGFEAVATTSGGVAWALGFADGEQAPWDDVVAATRRIAATVGVPVTADIESGYGQTPEQVANHVREIIEAGVVGINLEDGLARGDPPLRSVDEAAARIRAARAAARSAGVPVVINARIDAYLKNIGDAETRYAETVRRAEAYLGAGADCIFPFALTDLAIIARLAAAIRAPLNIVARPGLDVARLQALGVARVSTASAPALVAMSAVRELAAALRATGSFDVLDAPLKRADVQQLFPAKRT